MCDLVRDIAGGAARAAEYVQCTGLLLSERAVEYSTCVFEQHGEEIDGKCVNMKR